MNKLSALETAITNRELQEVDEISRVKSEWQKALKKLERTLGRRLNGEIKYDPNRWYEEKAGVTFSETGKMLFTTPNRVVDFDVYSSFQSKLFAVAHEKFGHIVDAKEYHGGDWIKTTDEFKTFITPEQRVNLRVAHLLPKELYDAQIEVIRKRFNFSKMDPKELGKYEMPLALIESLGRIGMQRNDDLLELFSKIQVVTELLMGYDWFCFAGISTPPALNESKEYGIKRMYEFKESIDNIAQYLKGRIPHVKILEILKRLNYKTTIDSDYKPEYSVGLTGINDLELALENLNRASSYWESVARHNNTYHAPEDMANALRSIQAKIEKHMKN